MFASKKLSFQINNLGRILYEFGVNQPMYSMKELKTDCLMTLEEMKTFSKTPIDDEDD